MQHKKNIALWTLAGCLAIAGGIAWFVTNDVQTAEKIVAADIEGYADIMIDRCKDATYRPTCYEQEVPKLVEEMPSEEIFNVIRAIRSKDREYLYCHVLAHDLGTYEVSLDPNNWLDVIAKGPTDGMCSNGFSHGALVARFNDGDMSEEEFDYALNGLSIACEEREGYDPTDLAKAICYHGVGHVLIHMTEADVASSILSCDQVGLKSDGRDYRKLCTEGVYMQLFQPLEPEDYALIDQLPYAPSRENLEQFCSENSKTEEQYGACWREAWPFFGDDIYNSEGLTQYCTHLTEGEQRDLCFISAFTINGRHNLGNVEKMAATCNGLPQQYQGQCFARGANAFPEEDPGLVENAVDMCSRATNEDAADECYAFLANVASFNFHPSSEAFENLCSALPDRWQDTCRKN